MKIIDVGILCAVIVISVILFLLLREKLSNNLIAIIILGFGFMTGLIRIQISKKPMNINI